MHCFTNPVVRFTNIFYEVIKKSQTHTEETDLVCELKLTRKDSLLYWKCIYAYVMTTIK